MSGLSQIQAGSRLTAAMAQGAAPLSAYKSGSTSTSSTTLAADSALFLALSANAVYDFELVIGYTGGGNFKFGWSLPSGATMGYAVYGSTTSSVATDAPWYTQSSTLPVLGSNGSTPVSAVMSGTVSVGSTAGNLQFEWAPSSSSSTSVLAGSVLLAWQVQ